MSATVQVKEKTLAKYTLDSPSEVLEFLQKVVAWGETRENAWHKAPACTGWHMRSCLDGRPVFQSIPDPNLAFTCLRHSVNVTRYVNERTPPSPFHYSFHYLPCRPPSCTASSCSLALLVRAFVAGLCICCWFVHTLLVRAFVAASCIRGLLGVIRV